MSPIYAMLLLFGCKTLILLKCFIYYKKTSLRMFFQTKNSHTGSLFKGSKILKYFNKTALENCIFISKYLKGILPFVFNSWLKFSLESNSHDTRWLHLGYLKIPSYCNKTYGRYSVFVNAIYAWNHLQSCHQMSYFISWEQIYWKRY